MKKFRKLIPALCMLLVSALFVGTSTYAWFSMNTQVTATDMKVTAKSDTVFLQIKGDADQSFSTTGRSTMNSQLYPVQHKEITTVAGLTNVTNWQYRYNKNAAASQDDPTAFNDVADGKFANYVASTTYKVKLDATNSGVDTAYDLYVSNITIPENKGVKVIVACGEKFKEFDASATNIAFAEENVIADTVKTTEMDVTVYVYIDGDAETVYTNNINNLKDLGVTFTLDCSVNDHTA